MNFSSTKFTTCSNWSCKELRDIAFVDKTVKCFANRSFCQVLFFHRTFNDFVMEAPPCVLIYRVSQEECARLRESVPYVKVYRYNPKHLCPKLNGYGDNGQRSLKL